MKKLSILVTIILSLFLITPSAFPQQNPGGHNGNSILVNNTGAGGSSFTSLLDVTITSPVDGQTLRYNGTNWVNDSNLFNDGTNIGIGIDPTTTSLAGGLVIGNGTAASAILADSISMWADDFAAGDSRLYIMGEASTDTVIIGNGRVVLGTGTAANPALDFGSTGFYELSGNTIIASISGVNKWGITANNIDSFNVGGSFITRSSNATLPCYQFGGDPDTGMGRAAADQLSLIAGGVEGHRITEASGIITHAITGNVGINTATFDASAEGVIAIANGTAPAAGTANQSYIYARDVSASSEMHVMDEAGNETQISPHNPEVLANSDPTELVPFSYSSKNVYLGKEILLDMTAVIREVEKMSGKTFITVRDIPIQDKRDWSGNQEVQRVVRQNEIDAANAWLADLDAKILAESDPEIIAELTSQKAAIVVPAVYIKKQPPQYLKDRGIILN